MKRLKFTFIIVLLLAAASLYAQPSAKNSKPKAFSEFFRQDTTILTKGRFNIYQEKDRYFLEIPDASMDREVLIAIQTAQGTGSYVSPASGVYRFERGDKDKLNIYRSVPLETAMDSTDLYMMQALERSGLIPAHSTMPVAAYGKDSTSVIIDLTDELKNPGGLFSVNSFSLLNKPDPDRSGIEGFRMIDNGVVFSMKRIQTDRQTNPNNGKQDDRISAFIVEVTIEQLPERGFKPQKSDKSYGFDEVTINEYDSRRFVVRKQNYITKWDLADPRDKRAAGIRQITVYVDPVIPAEFRECVTRAVLQWNAAFAKAGIANAMRLSSDAADASMAYGTILMRWGNANSGVRSTRVDHPVTGEILAARINFMDASIEGHLVDYLLQCGHIDKRAAKDMYDIGVRRDILTSALVTELGKVLGLKANYPALSAYSTKELRNGNFVSKNGMSASVMGGTTFNYAVQSGDKIAVEGLVPSVSSYDYDAIAFAYAGKRQGPSERAAAYAPEDKYDPYAQAGHLSDDLVEGLRLGIENLKYEYPKLTSLAAGAKSDDPTWNTLSELVKKTFVVYLTYVNKACTMIGGRSIRPVPGKMNATTATWVSREEQIEAFRFIEDAVLRGVPQWLMNNKNLKAADMDADGMFLHNVNGLFNRFLSREVLESMVKDERMNKNAYTVTEMFAFFDRVIFADFDPKATFTTYQTNVQMALIVALGKAAGQNNITGGLSDSSVLLHSYLLKTAARVRELSKSHNDPEVRNKFQLMDQRLRRDYFDKPLQQ